MSGANERQVGGKHYRDMEGEMLWDRLIRVWGWYRAKVYFIGHSMKYMERHEKKGGLEALQKSEHFNQKIVEEEQKWISSEEAMIAAAMGPGPLSKEGIRRAAIALGLMKEEEKYQ